MMLIGHNPGMHELALMLAGSGEAAAKKSLEDNLPTAGLAILGLLRSTTGARWRSAAASSCASPARNC
jgi:phosphohistidine phosphatase SixA